MGVKHLSRRRERRQPPRNKKLNLDACVGSYYQEGELKLNVERILCYSERSRLTLRLTDRMTRKY